MLRPEAEIIFDDAVSLTLKSQNSEGCLFTVSSASQGDRDFYLLADGIKIDLNYGSGPGGNAFRIRDEMDNHLIGWLAKE